MLSALYYIHQKGIVHGKIHMNNVFFKDNKLDTNIKIIGVGGIPNDYEYKRKLTISQGYSFYLAPENIKKE